MAVPINIVGGGGAPVVATPELAILRRHALSFLGVKLATIANPPLQRITAWSAAKLLGAPRDGVFIRLPTVTLEVQEWCAGLITTKLTGLEVNVLRVAGTGLGLEWYGVASRHAIKEWMGWGATALGVGQVVGLGLALPWLSSRRAR